MRIYYLDGEYETGKHKIVRVWLNIAGQSLPEETPGLSISAPYSVLEIDEFYNKFLASQLLVNRRINMDTGGDLPDRFYIDSDGKLRDNSDDSLVSIEPNLQKEAYKLSQLYGLTHEQLDTYIDNNVTNLAEAKEFIRKMAHVILWLVKQTKLDE